MKINIDMNRLFDYMMEADNETARYYKLTNDYKKKHGCVVYLDVKNGLRTDEKMNIAYASRSEEKSNDIVRAFIEVAGFDQEQQARLMAAYRAVKRWYEKETRWERCLPVELLERIAVFVVG